MKDSTYHCPLCSSTGHFYQQDKRRAYYQCGQCELVFSSPDSWPGTATEKAEYDLHENDVDDAGYNRFLSRIVTPLIERIQKQSKILDFGCGPAPALANQLMQLEHHVSLYDVFYYPETSVLNQRFDAIVMTEVIEHLHTPANVIQSLWASLRVGGVLAIMTQRVIDAQAFSRWQYKNDPTHVCFYSDQTFVFLASHLKAQLEFVGRDMVFLTKS